MSDLQDHKPVESENADAEMQAIKHETKPTASAGGDVPPDIVQREQLGEEPMDTSTTDQADQAAGSSAGVNDKEVAMECD